MGLLSLTTSGTDDEGISCGPDSRADEGLFFFSFFFLVLNVSYSTFFSHFFVLEVDFSIRRW